jgi:hypothetical protein
MQHFARFVEFLQVANEAELHEFELPDKALEYIETFSRVYIDEERPHEKYSRKQQTTNATALNGKPRYNKDNHKGVVIRAKVR